MILLGRRKSCIRLGQIAPHGTSPIATFGGAVQAQSLLLYGHKYTETSANSPPSGFTQIGGGHSFGSTSGDFSWGIAAGGETTITGPDLTTDRSAAIEYLGCRIAQAVNASNKTNPTSNTITFPTLTLLDPGRSWAVGIVLTSSGGTGTGTTATQRVGFSAGSVVHMVDSNGPVTTWAGQTMTLNSSQAFAAWSLEIMSL